MSSPHRKFRFIRHISDDSLGRTYMAEVISPDGQGRGVLVKLTHQLWLRQECPTSLRHPHIIVAQEFTSIGGRLAVVMERLEGSELAQIMARLGGPGFAFPRGAVLEIGLAVASALDAALESPLRLLHGDLRPSQLFLTGAGEVKVMGFGLPHLSLEQRGPSRHDPHSYLAPELLLGGPVTPASDIFALGLVLFKLLTLRHLATAGLPETALENTVRDIVPFVPLRNEPGWDEQVRAMLCSMLSYDPARRPTARQLAHTLAALVQGKRRESLRRWASDHVMDILSCHPSLDHGDPLHEAIVGEDLSSDRDDLLASVLAEPRDDETRLVYADWLEEQGDEKATLLRAQVQGRPLSDPELAVRDPLWLACIDRTVIENCQGLDFQFECPKRWEDLAPRAARVRFCGTCAKEVYHCTSASEALEHANQKRCVAISSFAARRPGDLPLAGTTVMGLLAPMPTPTPPPPRETHEAPRRWWQFWR